MKSIHMTSMGIPEEKKVGTLALMDVPMPAVGPENVLVRVAYASICGSDGHVLRSELSPDLYKKVSSALPRPIGHEISGYVAQLGETAAKVSGLHVGDRITANYRHFCNSCYFCRTGQENFCQHPIAYSNGMSEYVSWHMSQIFKIPDEVSLLDASQTEPLSIALNACKTVFVRFGSRVLISGAGAIGLMAAQLARRAGASLVAVSDIVAEKREIAKQCGADAVFDPMDPEWKREAMALTDGLGFDAVIESSGASSAAQSVPELMSLNGHAVLFAMYRPNFEMKINPFVTFYQHSKHIHGMYTSADLFPQTIAMLKEMDFAPIIQHVYEKEEYQKAFDDQLSGKYAKLVFRFAGE